MRFLFLFYAMLSLIGNYFLCSETAIAAPAATLSRTDEVIAQGTVLRATRVLTPYLIEGSFRISATVVTDPAKTKTTSVYSSRFASPESVAAMSVQELRDAVKSYSITIFLSSQYQKEDQADIQAILTEILLLDAKRGDKIAFGKLALRKAPEDAQSLRELAKAQTEINTAKLSAEQVRFNAEQIRKERDDVKTQLMLTKNELDRLAREASESKLRSEQQNQILPVVSQLKKNVVSTMGAVLTFIGLALLGLAFFAISGRMGKGMSALAAAVSEIQPGKVDGGGNTISLGPENVSVAQQIDDGKSNRQAAPVQTLDVVYKRLTDLRGELKEMLVHPTSRTVLLTHLSNLLSDSETAVKASLILELLDRELAAKFYELLSTDHREEIIRCLRNSNYSKPKPEFMLDIGEELKTRMLVETLHRNDGHGSNDVIDGLARLTPAKMVDLVLKLQVKLIPRLFAYLNAKQTADLMVGVRAANEIRFDAILPKLLEIPVLKDSEELDNELSAAIEACINETSGNKYSPFLKRYAEMIENSTEDVGNALYKTLAVEPSIAAFLQSNVILFTTLFKLTPDLQGEIINSLSVKDTATLLVHLEEEEKQVIFAQLFGRNLELVQEEYNDQMNQGRSSKSERSFEVIKTKIIRTIRAYKTAGNLQFADSIAAKGSENANTEPTAPTEDVA